MNVPKNILEGPDVSGFSADEGLEALEAAGIDVGARSVAGLGLQGVMPQGLNAEQQHAKVFLPLKQVAWFFSLNDDQKRESDSLRVFHAAMRMLAGVLSPDDPRTISGPAFVYTDGLRGIALPEDPQECAYENIANIAKAAAEEASTPE